MRLVMIEWEDSHTEGGWQRLDGDLTDRVVVCRSVGWLILDGVAVKIVAPHLNEPEGSVPLQGSGVMHIPARAVLRVADLRPWAGSPTDEPCVKSTLPWTIINNTVPSTTG